MFAWDDLRYFLAFARTGSMLAAAKVLRVNQSTVQRRLAELERQIGHRLISRKSGGYVLTARGAELRHSAERVELAVAGFERDLAACDKGLMGTVRVTTTGFVADRLRKGTFIDAFHSRYPDLNIELLVSDRCLDLSNGEADVAIRAGEPTDETLVGRKIADMPWAIYAAQSYIDRHGAPQSIADIGRHSVVLCDDARMQCPSTQWLRARAPGARIVARCESGIEQVRMVQSGTGLGLLQAYDRDDGLVCLIEHISLVTPYYLLMHRDMQQTRKVRSFIDFVTFEIKTLRALAFR
jgi:DNA-binding transcriptional LysR family regulator